MTRSIAIATACLALGACLASKEITAGKVGEMAVGDRIGCTYDGAGMLHFRSVRLDQRCPDNIRVPAASGTLADSTRPKRVYSVARLTAEQRLESGKRCEYDFGGRQYAQMVGPDRSCPQSMRVLP